MARIARAVLIVFTYLFNLALAVFTLGIGIMGSWTGEPVHFDLIPLQGGPLVNTLWGLGAFGILALVLSFGRTKMLRLPMLLWNIAVLSLLVCAFTRPSYRFGGWDDFLNLIWLTVLAIVALWASWSHLRRTHVA
jgi:hypothetical protein